MGEARIKKNKGRGGGKNEPAILRIQAASVDLGGDLMFSRE